MDLTDKRISYIVMSSKKIEDIMSILWAKNFKILQIKGYYKGSYDDSILTFNDNLDNDDLRKEALFVLNHFKENSAVIKYSGDTNANKIFYDGSEKPMSVIMYNTDDEAKSYLYNGISFSFNENKRYWKPKNKSDLKVGMVVEYFNKNEWQSHKIKNPSKEYDRLFKLLIKYDKLRVESVI